VSSANIYREIILDHYRNPSNFGKIENPDIRYRESNALCGDVIEMHINIKENKLVEVKFNGKGCAICISSASLLTEKIIGQDVEIVKKINKQEMLSEIGLPDLGPTRIKCALLSLKVLKAGVYYYLIQKMTDKESIEKMTNEVEGIFSTSDGSIH